MYQRIVSRLQQVSHHLVMSQMWPLLRARFLAERTTWASAPSRKPIGGYLAAADGSQATWSGSAHVRMAVPRHLTGGMGASGELVPPTGRPGNWLGR